MKKIMFDNNFGLTDYVLSDIKTVTRRFEISDTMYFYLNNYDDTHIKIQDDKILVYSNEGILLDIKNTRYKVGEIVAIAQSYKDCGYPPDMLKTGYIKGVYGEYPISEFAGWNNKMFVEACMMKKHIKITDIRIEMLQDISDEDCLKEGIRLFYKIPKINKLDLIQSCLREYYSFHNGEFYDTPRKAFASLIDKVSGKGTWESNPYVVVNDFKLIKWTSEY